MRRHCLAFWYCTNRESRTSDVFTLCCVFLLHLYLFLQVKGISYALEHFLGENTWNRNDNTDYHRSLLHRLHHESELYQCVIYLAPGDYHR